MNKYLFILFFLFSSCKVDRPDVSDFNKTLTKDKENTRNSIGHIDACIKGCQFTFNTLNTLKKVNSQAINLSLTQILDFSNSCEQFCEKELMIQEPNEKDTVKEKKEIIKQKIDQKDDFLVPLENL